MSKKKDDVPAAPGTVLEGVPVFQQCGDHTHFAGLVDGVLRSPDTEPSGEVVYEAGATSAFVGRR